MAKRCSVVFILAACFVLRSGQGKVMSANECFMSRSHIRCALLRCTGKTLLVLYWRGAATRSVRMNGPLKTEKQEKTKSGVTKGEGKILTGIARRTIR